MTPVYSTASLAALPSKECTGKGEVAPQRYLIYSERWQRSFYCSHPDDTDTVYRSLYRSSPVTGLFTRL